MNPEYTCVSALMGVGIMSTTRSAIPMREYLVDVMGTPYISEFDDFVADKRFGRPGSYIHLTEDMNQQILVFRSE